MIPAVFSTMAILFAATFLGVFCAWVKLLRSEDSKIFIRLVFYVTLPCSLFESCYHAKISIFNPQYLITYTLAVIVISIIYFVVYRYVLKKTIPLSFMNTMSVTQVDGAYFAIPLFVFLFHDASWVIPLQVIQNVFFFTLLVFLIDLSQVFSNKSFLGQKKILKLLVAPLITFLKTPILVASGFGLLLSYLKISIPKNGEAFIELFAAVSAPVALFSVGLSFYAGFPHLFKKGAGLYDVFFLSFGKLVVFPLIAWLIGKQLGLSHEHLLFVVLVCASPAATHNFIVANSHRLNDKVQSNNIIVSTLLGFFTISFVIHFIGK